MLTIAAFRDQAAIVHAAFQAAAVQCTPPPPVDPAATAGAAAGSTGSASGQQQQQQQQEKQHIGPARPVNNMQLLRGAETAMWMYPQYVTAQGTAVVGDRHQGPGLGVESTATASDLLTFESSFRCFEYTRGGFEQFERPHSCTVPLPLLVSFSTGGM